MATQCIPYSYRLYFKSYSLKIRRVRISENEFQKGTKKVTLILDGFSDREKRFDRFPEAEAGFYNSVKIAIALFSTIVGSYPYSHKL